MQFVTDWRDDVAAFLGASYFRAVGGDTRQYGLSARALAVDTAFPRPEEFPRFTSFWFERPAKESGTLTLYALLDSPSIAGAMRFQIAPGGTQIMNIDTALYPRKPIERIGHRAAHQHVLLRRERSARARTTGGRRFTTRTALSMWTGAGEWIWRPLVNPPQLHLNSYFDDNPRGFGLLQRDRDFDHYQDDGVYYDRRPSLWVEPKPGPERRLGQGRRAAGRNTDRGRNLRQHRGVLESRRQAEARPGAAVQLPAVLGHENALFLAARRRPSRRAPASAAPSA